MASEGTASTVVLIAAILELIGAILGAVGLALVFMVTLPWIALLGMIDPLLAALMMSLVLYTLIASALGFIFSLIFAILWFMWRKAPSQHKMALIITGVLTLVFGVLGYLFTQFGWFGFLPGILAIIGGAIAKKGA